MSPVHNGPARNQPKGAPRPPVATDPTQCLCQTGPITIATFRAGGLVRVELRHLRTGGCGMPSEYIEPRAYQAGLRARTGRR